MAGRVDGVQYFRNGIATANTHRNLVERFGKLIENKIINPNTPDAVEKTEKLWARKKANHKKKATGKK
jgi:hypothetical protein